VCFAADGAGIPECAEKQQFAGKKFQLQYRRDDSDPSYWQHVTVKPDGQVVHTARFRVGEDFECTFIGGRNYKVVYYH